MNSSDIINKTKSEANSSLEFIARIGFAAKGLIYIIIGVLAIQIVLGMGGETAGLKNVLKTIDKQAQPIGHICLAVIALGLLAHAYWRLMQSIFNADNKKIDFKNILDRIGYFFSVIMYGALAYYSFKIIFGFGAGSSLQSLIGSVLSKPFGRWVIILAGLTTGGAGLYQVYFGLFSKFEFKYNLNEMNDIEEKITRYISMIGLAARGIVFIMISIFLVQAGLTFNSHKAGGIGKALSKALYEPYGHWLLATAAIGLAAYGGYCIILAKFRKIPIYK